MKDDNPSKQHPSVIEDSSKKDLIDDQHSPDPHDDEFQFPENTEGSRHSSNEHAAPADNSISFEVMNGPGSHLDMSQMHISNNIVIIYTQFRSRCT